MSNDMEDDDDDVWVPEPYTPPLAGLVAKAAPTAVVEIGDPVEMMKSKMPQMVARAIQLGLESDKLTEVMALLKEMNDRVYGKAVQQIQADIRSVELKKIEVNFV